MKISLVADLRTISWRQAWSYTSFKIKFFSGWALLFCILSLYPYFFSFIQKREGIVLDDWLLSVLPSADVSNSILVIICLTVLLGVYRTVQNPYNFLVYLWAYIILNLSRIITITLVPLDPPAGLTALVDPLAFPFYGGTSINKDLFYSGHTASMFMVYLLVEKKWEKAFALIATILIGILLLLQHIHYTIDVLAAPVFVYFIVLFSKRICLFH